MSYLLGLQDIKEMEKFYRSTPMHIGRTKPNLPEVKSVFIDKPHFTILWTDGTHTTVTCAETDTFSLRTGFLYAAALKAIGGSHKQLTSYLNQLEQPLTDKEKAIWKKRGKKILNIKKRKVKVRK